MSTATASAASRSRFAAELAIATAAVDLAILIAFHALAPEIDPLRSPTSDYVHGSGSFLAPVGTFLAGIGGIALALALNSLRPDRRLRVGQFLLVIFGIAKMVQAFFPIAPADTTTTAGIVHNVLGNIAFFVLPVAAILLGRPIAQGTGHRAPVILALLIVITTIVVLIAAALDLFGLGQRLYLVTAAGWVICCALAARGPRTQRFAR